MTDKEFDELCQVDKYNLDQELEKYLGLVGYCLRDYEQLRAEVEQKKYELDTLYALKDIEIRLQAKEAREKLTEKTVENRVRLDKDYHNAYLAYLDARKRMGEAGAILEVLRRRKFVIEQLIQLYTIEYFGVRVKQGDRAVEASAKSRFHRRKENGI